MTEISIYLGYNWMLRNPKFLWNVVNGSPNATDVMEYFLQSVGNRIYHQVKEGDSFTLHVISDKSSRSFVLKRLPDGEVIREEEGKYGMTLESVYCVNLEMVSTGQKISINHYYAGGGNTSTILSGATNAINSFKSRFSDYLSSTQRSIQDFKDQFNTDKIDNAF